MGGTEYALRLGYYAEPSNDASKWLGVTVEGGRMKKLKWRCKLLRAPSLAAIRALSALIHLDLDGNGLNGAIPPELGGEKSIRTMFTLVRSPTNPPNHFSSQLSRP